MGALTVFSFLFMAVVGFVGLLLYFVPSFIAFKRGHPNRNAIFVLNLLLGGTGLGWVGALVWSLTNK